MDGELDPELQRIINTATGIHSENRAAAPLNYLFMDNRQKQWSFGAAPSRQPMHDVIPFNGSSRELLNDNSSRRPGSNFGSARVSLASRNTFNQPETRAITNADNHFRFAQNIRQRPPVSQVPTMLSHMPSHSPVSQLVNRMLLPNPIQQNSPEVVNFLTGHNESRYNQLQPQRQQITPPFNLGGFICSSNALGAASSSSSPLHDSSPTARVSLRRNTLSTHPLPGFEEFPQSEHDFREQSPFLDTAQPQMATPSTKSLLQTQAHGHAPPMAHGIQLVSPHELPDRFRQIFPYQLFNAVQSKCFAPIYNTNDNVVVSAPTGSGKTALLELAICKLVYAHNSGQFKIVYQAPTKSLCSERVRDWQKKFSHLNLSCAELTGDTSQAEMRKVRDASIIVTTPEKWDSITRKWKDYIKLLQMVKLFLIDEVHILKDIRGATLEAVVSRMKTIGANVRFVALSATVPNSQDIALWLGKDHTNNHIPAHRETFGEDFRPVKLQKHVHGYDGNMNEFAFEKTLDAKLPDLIQKYHHKKPIMVFCFTRKSCEGTAARLAEWWSKQRVVDRPWPAPLQRTVVGSKELTELVGCGVAFHHAGLDAQDRNAIEKAFLKGDISLICCTSTLAVGVNLPCHMVVLKGTVGYQEDGLVEYSDLEVMQMLGRAGRPQFDTSAVAIIMTRNDKVERYKKMISGQDVLESTLHLNLIEHLNSEIGLGTIHDVYSAKHWLAGTFLSVRMTQNPNYYKIEGIAPSRDADRRLELVCERDIKLLQDNELVSKDESFTCTSYGEAMSRYMVKFETMKLLLTVPQHAKTEQILHVICQASEFKDLRIKPNERVHLREFNKSPYIKFPIKENVATTAHKISLMIQVQLGGVDLPTNKEFVLIRRQWGVEKNMIFERTQRLIRCIIDCKLVDCDAISTLNALGLARSFSAQYWENSQMQLMQIPQFGPVAVRKLVGNNINSVEKLANLDSTGIERVMGRNPPFGKKVQDILAKFPLLTLAAEIMGRVPSKTGEPAKVNVKAGLGFTNANTPIWEGKVPSLTFMAGISNGTLVHFWRGDVKKLDKGFELEFVVELCSPEDEIELSVACDEMVGTVRFITLRPDIPASAFPPQKAPREEPNIQSDHEEDEQNNDDFEGEAIDDQEMLAALRTAEGSASDNAFEDLADDDALDQSSKKVHQINNNATEDRKPVKMENGKWECNHQCRGGQVTKSGQPCKHRCCKEGLNKPRKSYKKKSAVTMDERDERLEKAHMVKKLHTRTGSSIETDNNQRALGTNPESTGGSTNGKTFRSTAGNPQLKLKAAVRSNLNQDTVEIIDLAKEMPPVSYADVAPRDYRKLQKLHNTVQRDQPFKLPKYKPPQFQYASGERPDLSFLLNEDKTDDDLTGDAEDTFSPEMFSEDEEFPSPSAMLYKDSHDEDPFGAGFVSYQRSALKSSDQDDSLENLEAGMIDLADSIMLKQPSPELNSSFENSILDFSACQDKVQEKSSGFVLMDTLKRSQPASPEMPEAKSCRLTEAKSADQRLQRSVPSWVDEFDPDLIDGLKGFVDFVD